MAEIPPAPKPSEIERLLVKRGPRFRGLTIDYRQTGVDTADTWWLLLPHDKEKPLECKANEVESLLSLRPNYNSVCEVHDHIVRNVEVWDKFLKDESREFAQFQRLKAKFEP
jgi:hypothetical protein